MNTDGLKNTVFLKGLSDKEIEEAARFLRAERRIFRKGERILSAGDLTDRMGYVLKGSATIESNDLWGNRTILNHVAAGQFFAETYAFLEKEVLLVDVTANETCEILFLAIGGLARPEVQAASWGGKLAVNLLAISARKNLLLSRRSFHTSPKTIRGRVMAYLNSFALQAHSKVFEIPFDRQQLADYLNVERTALSKELGRMQKDGLITYRRNHFTISEFDPDYAV